MLTPLCRSYYPAIGADRENPQKKSHVVGSKKIETVFIVCDLCAVNCLVSEIMLDLKKATLKI
jgi:hypothetical protein